MTDLRPQAGQEEHTCVLAELVRAAGNPPGEGGKTAKSTHEKDRERFFSYFESWKDANWQGLLSHVFTENP